uniref:Brain cDNA, clone: QnpA-19785, similar to human protein kinase C, alpha binding protein (PRKCABP) n=1 Tax=Macaca fascicularis TaxID=9541 RepID=Q4R4K1_MACFA|nr:unnamed protein product [Macaca fascicularis]
MMGPWTRVEAGVTPECPAGMAPGGRVRGRTEPGSGAGPPSKGATHKGLLAWGACLPAPLSSHSEPGLLPRTGTRVMAWDLDTGPSTLPPLPAPWPEGELGLWTCLRKEREGRKEKKGLGGGRSPGPAPCGHSHCPRSLPAVGPAMDS